MKIGDQVITGCMKIAEIYSILTDGKLVPTISRQEAERRHGPLSIDNKETRIVTGKIVGNLKSTDMIQVRISGSSKLMWFESRLFKKVDYYCCNIEKGTTIRIDGNRGTVIQDSPWWNLICKVKIDNKNHWIGKSYLEVINSWN